MNVKEKFLELTSRTYPNGFEYLVGDLLPDILEVDSYGNVYMWIGDSPTIMFTSHLDTATSVNTEVNHVIDGNIIKTDGTSILGADDKAGVVIMLKMIENKIPGLYYFFIGEEVGCLGSKNLLSRYEKDNTILKNINKVVSFDRRGEKSVITHQFGMRCCSDAFGEALAKSLNEKDSSFDYSIDQTGINTDSSQFKRNMPECTNISVGYLNEHTFAETQNIEFLEKLAEAVCKIDWESLPIERDPKKVEYRDYYRNKYYDYDDDVYGYGYGISGYPTNTHHTRSYGDDGKLAWEGYNKSVRKQMAKPEAIWFFDTRYGYWSTIYVNKITRKVEKVDLDDERINYEKEKLISRFHDLNLEFSEITWNGIDLCLKNGKDEVRCSRNELTDLAPELNFWEKLNISSKNETSRGTISGR